MFRALIFIAPAALAVTALASPALAQQRVADVTHIQVKADDLATPDKVRMLYRRIEAAAQRVCDSDDVTVMTQQADKACETQAISDTIQSVDAPQLAALDPTRDHRHTAPTADASSRYASR